METSMTHGGHFHRGSGRALRAAWREYAAMMAGRRGRGGGGEGEEERGGPGGRWGRGGWGRGGGRALGNGDLRILVLALIGEKPRHGYDLIRAISDRFAGAYTPSPGAVYPLLTMLEEEELISASAEGAKKLYTLTSDGEAWLKENDAAVQGILTRIDMAASAYSSQTAPESVWEAWKTLKQAMNMPRAPWTEAEADRIRAILEKAARDIVRPPESKKS
jgi:DNA-binding PadR family transcriptional regulator